MQVLFILSVPALNIFNFSRLGMQHFHPGVTLHTSSSARGAATKSAPALGLFIRAELHMALFRSLVLPRSIPVTKIVGQISALLQNAASGTSALGFDIQCSGRPIEPSPSTDRLLSISGQFCCCNTPPLGLSQRLPTPDRCFAARLNCGSYQLNKGVDEAPAT